MALSSFIEDLRDLGDESHRLKLLRFGIPNENALGVPMPDLKNYVKPFRGDAELALELYDSDYHEAKLAAGLIYPASQLSLNQADRFMEAFYSWDLVDQFCGSLFQKASFARDLPFLWSPLPGEFQRRSGLVMIVAISIHHKKLADQELLAYLPLLKESIDDERNFVKKAHSWVLRTLGKRSPWLNKEIRDYLAREWRDGSGDFRYWAARDAWKELNDPKVLARIEKQAERRAKSKL